MQMRVNRGVRSALLAAVPFGVSTRLAKGLLASVSPQILPGTDVAVEAGDVVLVRSDPRAVPRTIELSRVSYRKMVQNLWWASGSSIVAIPLAAGVLASKGIVLSPAVGAVLMSLSTVVVAINAQLLRRARLLTSGNTHCVVRARGAAASPLTPAPGLLQFDRRKPGIEAQSRP
jgi:hypothetical protein